MNELIQAGLVGAGRVSVRPPTMVSRYNSALARIGVTPTALTEFSIDGVGWSAEIAKEKSNAVYLFQGDANRCAIVLTPDQQGKPIYFPYASYERALMRAYFKSFRKQIVDITTTHPMVLIFDQEITRYETPLDLLLDSVTVKTDTEGLVETAGEQKTLIAELMKDDRWTDTELRKRLASSAKLHGDLRFRNTQVADLNFPDCQHFFTEAFGGVYIIRVKKETLLILEHPERAGLELGPVRDGGVNVIALADPNLPTLLANRGLVTVDFEWYAENQDVLEDLHECLVAKLVTDADPTLTSYAGTSASKRKSILARLSPEKLQLLSLLERLQRRLKKELSDKPSSKELALQKELALLLFRVVGKGKNPRRDPRYETVSMVLARLRSHDPLELYRADKNRFVEEFKKWPAAYREWATARIAERYEPVMNQPLD